MNVLDKLYVITLANGDQWAVPVRVIAEDRAAYYAKKDNVSLESAMADTAEYFSDSDGYEIENWAQNEMNWSDVKPHAKFYAKAEIDDDADPFQEAWTDSEACEVVDE